MTRLAKAMSAFTNGRGAQSAGRLGIASACLLSLLGFAGISASAAVAADKNVVGFFGASGSLAGQLETPRGVAVNQANGRVYVAEGDNNRVSVFDSSGTFLRAFGQDVVASGQNDNGVGYEICVPADGDFCQAGIGEIEASGGGAIQNPHGIALDAAGNVYLSEQNKVRVQKFDADGNFLLAFGRDVVFTGPGNAGTSEVQTVTIKGTSGSFALNFGGQTTDQLDFDAGASAVEGALNALSSIGGVSGEVSVSGPVSGAYTITFGGSLRGNDVAQTTASAANLAAPVGEELTCVGGPGAATLTYQWLRNGAPIDGATNAAYTTTGADAGTAIQCRVRASNTEGASLRTAAALTISPFPGTAPPVIGFPSISGLTTVGQELTCASGSGWSGDPSFTYRWLRNGAPIDGATDDIYTLTPDDNTTGIQCEVTGANAGGTVVAYSNRAVIASVPPSNSGLPDTAPTIAGSAAVGQTLSCSNGIWSGSSISFTHRWLRNGASIDGANNSTYMLTGDDAGTAVQCQVVATNAGGSGTAISENAVVDPPPATAPPIRKTGAVGLTGTRTVGSTITCARGAVGQWPNSPTTIEYEFLRGGVTIPGTQSGPLVFSSAANRTYTLVADDLDELVQCRITVANAGGASSVTSPATPDSVVVANPPSATAFAPGQSSLVAAATTTQGVHATEICVPADGDICKAGSGGTLGGEFGTTFNGHLAVAPAGAPNAGNLLVTDPANRRVQEFTPAGAFVRAFGYDVKTGGVTTFEVCEVASECKIAAAAGTDPGRFGNNTPNRIAVDSDGNIYTVEPTTPNFRVQKFTLPGNVVTPQGTFAEAHLKGTSSAGAGANNPTDIAIDPATKNVLVAKIFPAGSTASCPVSGASSVQERRILEVSSTGVLDGTHMTCAGINVVNGLAMRSSLATGEVYASSTTGQSRLYVLDATALGAPSVSFGGFSDIGPHGATVTGFVNPNGPAALPYGLTTGYHFAYKRSSDPTFQDSAPANDANVGRGTANVQVTQVLGGLEAGTSYDVKLVAKKPFGDIGTLLIGNAETAVFSFSTPPAKPEVGIPSATTTIDPDTGEARAALYGSVNPNSKATTYRFEYGKTDSYGTKIPAVDESVGSGAQAVKVAQFVAGLEPDTTYHFRIVAKNVNGAVVSPDRTFTTPPVGAPGSCDNEAVREQQGIADTVPDCRAYELVSPADKGSSGSMASFDVLVGQLQIHVQASQAGGAAVYPIQNGIPESTAGGLSRWHAKRIDEGWQQQQVSGPSLIDPTKRSGGDTFALPSLVHFASPDLSCAIVRSYNPLTEDTPQAALDAGMENLYRWDADDGSYELISNVLPANPGINVVHGALYSQIDASDDCKRVFFISHYRFIPGASGLYEWGDGVLRDAGVLPNGGLGAGFEGTNLDPEYDGGGPQRAVAGAEFRRPHAARWNAVSRDGRRFFFTAIANQGPSTGRPAIFMREVDENGDIDVIEVSASQTAAVPTNGARFETASPDAGTVVFRANYGIAATSSAGPTNQACGPLRSADETDQGAIPSIETRSCDLYAYDVETGELTDISADPNPADSLGAQAQGAVAIDEDGSHIYFATLGQLIPGKGRTYAQNTAGNGSANIYLWTDGELSYVATLDTGTSTSGSGNADLFGGGNAVTASLYGVMMRVAVRWRAETSADGSRLLFPASANLTGNAAGGGKKAYLYSAEAEELTCISCPADGSPTLVTEDGRLAPLPSSAVASREPAGLLTRPRRAGLTYRASSMSEDGSRVFFASLDALAPGAISGERNVYQWHQGKVSFLAIVKPSGAGGYAELFDVSADGKDVLIATNQQLVPEDKDTVSDLYNVRVDGGFLFEEPAPACQVDEAVPLIPAQIYCQGAASAQPGAVGLASPGFFGPGNPAPAGQPARRCNRKQVRRGKRCVAKRALARRACAKRKGKAKRRCVANQMRRLNRVQQRQWRQQQRRANANRGGAR